MGIKRSSNFFGNDDESTKAMEYIRNGAQAKNVASKIAVDDVFLYGCTAENILAYFITVLDVLNTTTLHSI